MKWFFALNQSSTLFDSYCEMAKAAVISASKNTDLEPVLLFDGNSPEFIHWMQNHRVTVIQMESSLSEELAKIAPDRLEVSKGAFLRVDVPWVMEQMSWTDPYVLYTDCDVLFLKSLDFSDIRPTYFAVTSEINIEDNLNMNSGVMVMNIENLQRTYQKFRRFIIKYLNHFAYLDYDQTAYRCYYHIEWQTLPPEYNWKPYWEMNQDAKILHFHGPKPTEKELARQKELPPIKQDLVNDGYFHWVTVWECYAEEAQQTASREEKTSELSVARYLNTTTVWEIDSNRFLSKEAQHETQLDNLYHIVLQQSIYRQYCDDEICDWRAVKGSFTLWTMYHRDDFEAYLAFSEFFQFLEQLENEYTYLVFAYNKNPNDLRILKKIGVNFARRKKYNDAKVL
jgi:lipopolysaccharide biosynthesis glycosyltransferase